MVAQATAQTRSSPKDQFSLDTAHLERRYDEFHEIVRSSDVNFLSIPKSGRTWVRFFLQEYFAQVSGVSLPLRPRTMPSTRRSPSIAFLADFYDIYEHREGKPRIVFNRELRQKPLILLVRNPLDVAISWYYFVRAQKPDEFERNVPGGRIADFLRSPIYGVERIAQFHLCELALFREHAGPKLLLSYETLLSSGQREFERIVRFLSGEPLESDVFAEAYELASFGAMQALEKQISREGRSREWLRLGNDRWAGDVNNLKVRRGRAGAFREAFPNVDVNREFPTAAEVLRTPIDPIAQSGAHWSAGKAS